MFTESMKRREFLLGATAALGTAAFGGCATKAKHPPHTSKNVLFVISDDLNDALGCYGHPYIQTPNIDRLASRGLRFDRSYCQFPLCNPSRASMLTSMLPDETGVFGNGTHFREHHPGIVTLPEAFRNAGYYTARVGKLYHYGVPKQIGTDGLDDAQSWDEVVNPRGRDVDDEDKIFSLRPGKFGGTISWLAAEGTDDEQTDAIGASAAIDLLDSHKHEPFFIALGFYRPHTPYVAPKKNFDLYPLDNIEVPTIQTPRDPKAAFLGAKPEQATMTDLQRKQAIQAYCASVTFMDAQLGRVLDALDTNGLRENTIVVFTSDHGYHLGEHGLWQKRSLFEEAARVPLIIADPGMATAGHVTSNPAELIDLFPTLTDLCGLPRASHISGKSLAPLMDDVRERTRDAALTQELRKVQDSQGNWTWFKGYTIRTERYRYTEWDDGRRGIELYDHEADPVEMNNLVNDRTYSYELMRLGRLMKARRSTIRLYKEESVDTN